MGALINVRYTHWQLSGFLIHLMTNLERILGVVMIQRVAVVIVVADRKDWMLSFQIDGTGSLRSFFEGI
jgi:hypothetical protein